MFHSITRRKIVVGLLVVGSTLGIAGLIAILAIRMGYLESWIETRVRGKLAEYGVRLEIGSLRSNLRQISFEANDLKFYVEDAKKPFATVKNVTASVSLVDILGLSGPTDIRVKECVIAGLRAEYVLDAEGRSNLDGLHRSTNPLVRFNLVYSSGATTVKDAEFRYLDELHKLDGTAREVALALSPGEGDRMPLRATSRDSEFVYDGRALRGLDIDLRAMVNETGALIEEFNLRSPFGLAALKGELKSWRAFDYKLEGNADLKLREISRVFSPDLKLGGTARVDGQVEGSGIDFRASGKLRGDNLLARDVRLDGLTLTASGSGNGGIAKADTEVAIRLLNAAGFTVNRFSAAGGLLGGSSGFEWNGLLRGDSFAGHGVNGEGVSITRAQLSGPFDDPSQLKLKGEMKIASLVTADVRIGSVSGEVLASLDEIIVPSFDGSFFGGHARGRARARFAGEGQCEIAGDLTDVDVGQAVAAALGKPLPVSGRAAGRVEMRWPSSDYRSAEGTVDLTFVGDALNPGDPLRTDQLNAAQLKTLPIDGTLGLTARDRRLSLGKVNLKTGQTELTASGSIGWEGTGAFDVSLVSRDAVEFQRLVTDFSQALDTSGSKLLVENLREYEILLDRGLRFQGQVTGELDRPAIKGAFTLDSISVSNEPVGELKGALDYRSDTLHLENARLNQPDGGHADFSFDYRFHVENSAKWSGKVEGILLGPLASFVTDAKLAGKVTGTAELTGIPAAMRGTGQFTVTAVKYEDWDAKEVRGAVTLNGTRIETRDLVLSIAGGAITGSGWLDTKTKGYSANLRGAALEVAELVNSGRDNPIELSGLIDISLEAASEEFRRQETGSRVFDRLKATIASRELRYGSEVLGVVQLQTNGAASVAELGFAANLLGHRYSGAGTIDFSRHAGPVQGKIDLQEVALAPIAEALSKNDISTPGTVSGEVRFAGNLFGEKDPLRVEAELTKLVLESNDMRLEAQPPVLIKWVGDQVDVGKVRFSGPETNVEISGTLAVGEKGRMGLAAIGDVNLRILQNFVKDVTADGVVRVQMSTSGDFRQPRLSGSASVENASLRSREFPVALTKGTGRLIFTADQAQIDFFSGEVGGGSVSLSGGAALVGFVPDRWRVQARLGGVRIDYPQDFRTTVDGDLSLQGSRRLQVLAGLVNVRRSEYLAETDLFDLVERFMLEFGDSGGARSNTTGFPPTQFDLRVLASDSLVISNKSLDLVASADVRLRGSLDDPIFGGRLTISRGLIDDLFKERYRITSGVIEFPGISQRPPRLSIDTETVISGYRLSVLIAGPFDNLRITPRSEPPLPQADVIALMTTGALPREGLTGDSPSQSLAQTQPTNLATLLTQPLSSRIGSNVTGRLFGLNRFSIDPLVTGRGSDPTARVTVGRRVTRDLSITYSTNLASNQDQVILIEYRASDRLSFVASRAEDGAFGLDVRLRKRF